MNEKELKVIVSIMTVDRLGAGAAMADAVLRCDQEEAEKQARKFNALCHGILKLLFRECDD